MPYEVKWGPNDGDVSIWNESAAETLQLVQAYEDEGKTGFEIRNIDGLVISKDELSERSGFEKQQSQRLT